MFDAQLSPLEVPHTLHTSARSNPLFHSSPHPQQWLPTGSAWTFHPQSSDESIRTVCSPSYPHQNDTTDLLSCQSDNTECVVSRLSQHQLHPRLRPWHLRSLCRSQSGCAKSAR